MTQKLRFLFSLLLSVALMTGCKKDDPNEVVEEPPLQIQTSEFCENTCIFANDGECDDGGSNAASDFCEYGTDCEDCGLRTIVRTVDR
jgi:hypothetical protein